MIISLRPHHFFVLDHFLFGIYRERGPDLEHMREGFSEKVVQNFHGYAEMIKENHNQPIVMIHGEDNICNTCAIHHPCRAGRIDIVKAALGPLNKDKYESAEQMDERAFKIYNFFYKVQYDSPFPALQVFPKLRNL